MDDRRQAGNGLVGSAVIPPGATAVYLFAANEISLRMNSRRYARSRQPLTIEIRDYSLLADD